RLALRRRAQWEQEVEDEIKLHLLLRTEQLVALGHTSDDAYAEAVRRFGALDESRERLMASAQHRERHMQWIELLGDLRQDLAFAWRTFTRQKSWVALTIITFALGIGATTAVFSLVSSLLLHPLPYPDGDRVVLVDQLVVNPAVGPAPSGLKDKRGPGKTSGLQITIQPATALIRAWQA